MAKNNEKTPEEIQAEKDEVYKLAKANLDDSYMKGLFVAKTSRKEDYGTLLDEMYSATVEETPSTLAYQSLFVPELMSDEGAVTKERIKGSAMKITSSSLANLSVTEALKYSGTSKTPTGEYVNKDVKDLDDETKRYIFLAYAQGSADDVIANQVLPKRKERRKSMLEEKFCSEPENKN